MLQRLFQLIKQKEWVQVKREAEGFLRLANMDNYTLGRIYRALGRANFGLTQYDACKQCWNVGLVYATRAGDWDTVGFMQHNLAAVEMVMGNLEAAQAGFEAFLLYLGRCKEVRSLEGKTHYNLGLLYRQKKQYDLAIAAYSQALNCFQEHGELTDAGDTEQNLAWLLLLMGDREAARYHVNRAATYLDKASDDFHTEQLVLNGFLHLALGDHAACMGYLTPVLEGRVKVYPRHKAAARWVVAELYVAQGQAEIAWGYLQEALTLAMDAKETHLVNLCMETDVRVRVRLGTHGRTGTA